MSMAWIILLAALVPLVATISAKIGGAGFTNNEPRSWLSNQTGWRARANAAQNNIFETLPFFYAALLYAYFNQGNPQLIQWYAIAWLLLRLFYIFVYIKDWATLRSLLWALSFVISGLLLFT